MENCSYILGGRIRIIASHLSSAQPARVVNVPKPSDEINQLIELRRQLTQSDLQAASAACDRFNEKYPASGDGWLIRSQLAQNAGDSELALRTIDRALALEPTRAEWLLHKANCLGVLGRRPEAREIALRLANGQYKGASETSSVGMLLSRARLHEEARDLFRQSIAFEPHVGSHYYKLAAEQRYLGELQQAEENLDKAIELNRDDIDAWSLRSGLRQQTTENNHIDGLRTSIERNAHKPARLVSGNYALAKELEDVGRYEESFAALLRGSEARRQHMRYDVTTDIDTMERILGAYDSAKFDGHIDGHIDAAPIFVIGLPRSGNALVEQTLGAHSVVRAGGELNSFARSLVETTRQLIGDRQATPAELVRISTGLDFETLGRTYAEMTRDLAQGQVHFVDRLSMNFLYAGLIHLALPKARIVHVTRDPLDACYAIYKTLFKSAYPYSYDLDDLGRYYIAYRKLMQHWKEVMPDVMFELSYEQLVSERKATVEGLLSYCSLSWEDACVEPHLRNSEAVGFSNARVRQAVHQDSIGGSGHVAAQLEPLAAMLSDHGMSGW